MKLLVTLSSKRITPGDMLLSLQTFAIAVLNRTVPCGCRSVLVKWTVSVLSAGDVGY